MNDDANRRKDKRADPDNGGNDAFMRLARTDQHGINGLRAGIAKKPPQSVADLAANSVLPEQEAGNGDGNDNEGANGKNRIISQRGAKASILMTDPLGACIPNE